MRAVLLAVLVALLPAAHADSALDRAYDEVVAARAALQRAEEAQKAGEEAQEGDRIGIVTPPGKRPRSRLSEDYFERQKRLEQDLERARRDLDEALKRWNALK
jgi:hypothetical protein